MPSARWFASNSYVGTVLRFANSALGHIHCALPAQQCVDAHQHSVGVLCGRLAHPVTCKILAQRWMKASRRKANVHPVVCLLLAQRWKKATAQARRARSLDGKITENAKPTDQEMQPRKDQEARIAAELAWQRETPLCLENVERLYPDMRDVVLGNRIFRLVSLTDARDCGKVTGMVLEGFSTKELFDVLHMEEETVVAAAICDLTDQAHEVLQRAAQEEAKMQQVRTHAARDTPAMTGVGEEQWKVVKPKRRRV